MNMAKMLAKKTLSLVLCTALLAPVAMSPSALAAQTVSGPELEAVQAEPGLTRLTFDVGLLSPDFTPETESYTLEVPSDTTEILLTPVFTGDTLFLGGQEFPSGQEILADTSGEETSLRLTAVAGDSTREYVITVKKTLPAGDTREENFLPGEEEVAKGTFRWAATAKDVQETYYYGDSYFKAPATTYNPSLSTMSLCLAMSCFSSYDTTGEADAGLDYLNQSKNAQALLKDIGFQQIQTNEDYRTQPTTESIGVVAGYKMIPAANGKTMPLLVVGLRGAGYEREWAGNFTMGENDDHKGFNLAADKVVAYLQSYVQDQPELQGREIKLWIAGFSRAAAVSSLTAAKLNRDENLLGAKLVKDNLFAYTFETPMGGMKSNVKRDKDFTNIFCIINGNDIVTKVAPGVLDFAHYGVTVNLPTRENSKNYDALLKKMLSHYRVIEGDIPYAVDNFMPYKWWYTPPGYYENPKGIRSQAAFGDNFLNKFGLNYAENRTNYVKTYEPVFQDLVKLAYEISEKENGLMLKFLKRLSVHSFQHIPNFFIQWPKTVVRKILDKTLKDCNINLTAKQVDRAVDTLTSLMLKMIFYKKHLIDDVGSIYYNMGAIAQGHQPNLTKAWLEAGDPLYQQASAPLTYEDLFTSGEYRELRLYGVDTVELESADGASLLVLENGELTDQKTLTAGFSQAGELQIYLPTDNSYQVRATTNETGTLLYAVDEYSPELSSIKRLSYYQGDCTQGLPVVSEIPAFTPQEVIHGIPDGSDYPYTLSLNSNSLVLEKDLGWEEMVSDGVTHAIEADGDQSQGMVQSSGIVLEGRYAHFQATPWEGFAFQGWYDNSGALVSDQAFYTFPVDGETPDEILLTARFTQESKVVVYPVVGGAITASNLNPEKNQEVLLTSAPEADSGLRDLTVTGEDGTQVPIQLVTKDTYRFVYPGPVTVLARFEQAEHTTSPQETAVDAILKTDSREAYVQGIAPGLFGKEEALTRAQAAVMVYRLLQNPPQSDTPQIFTDTSQGAWYQQAVSALVELGLLKGYEDGSFRPDQPITRAELFTLVSRLGEVSQGLPCFTDVSPTHWAYASINSAVSYGWILGYGDSTCRPTEAITRAEGVTVFNRVLGRIPDKTYIDAHLNELMTFQDLLPDHWSYYPIMEAANSFPE